MKHFKVKIGFGKDDFISIDENELPMALRAQITGKVGVFNEGTVSGNNIIAITPDYNRLMGYNRDYQLDGEDYNHIGKATVSEYREFLENTKIEVNQQLSGNTSKLLK